MKQKNYLLLGKKIENILLKNDKNEMKKKKEKIIFQQKISINYINNSSRQIF
jgi:hypothetical protein